MSKTKFTLCLFDAPNTTARTGKTKFLNTIRKLCKDQSGFRIGLSPINPTNEIDEHTITVTYDSSRAPKECVPESSWYIPGIDSDELLIKVGGPNFFLLKLIRISNPEYNHEIELWYNEKLLFSNSKNPSEKRALEHDLEDIKSYALHLTQMLQDGVKTAFTTRKMLEVCSKLLEESEGNEYILQQAAEHCQTLGGEKNTDE